MQLDGVKPVTAYALVPHIEQKGVDLLIGLDIARLSLNQQVSTIVIVSGDSDLFTYFKFARRESVRIHRDPMNHGMPQEMKAHVDRVFTQPEDWRVGGSD